MSTLQDNLFEYLKKKIPNFQKTTKSGAIMFTCPNQAGHKFKCGASATFMGNSDKISCLYCNFKGTMYDAVRLLEPELKNKSDAEITSHLMADMHLDMYKELDVYQVYKWSLIPIVQNSKIPMEKDWVNTEHTDRIKWIKWLNNGLNIGLNCEKSDVIVVDVDNKGDIASPEEREKLIALLKASDTLCAKTPSGGEHYIFQVDGDIPQVVNMAGLKIDTRCGGGQIVIAPSKINGAQYQWVNLGVEIKTLTPELKTKILELVKKPDSSAQDNVENTKNYGDSVESVENTEPLKLKNNNLDGCCNNTFTQLGGILINRFTPDDTSYILHLLNKNLLEQPMPSFSIDSMVKTLSGYKISDEESQENAIYEYLKLVQNDVGARDIIESTGLKRATVDKYLSKFVKEGKAIRLARGRYQYREKIEWSDSAPEIVAEYKYKIPFFNNIAYFQDRDVILIGARTNDGKTTIAMNFLKQMIDQGVKPFYIYSEAGSRFQKISKELNITSKYYHTYHANPLAIELERDSFSIIDWLHLEHKENTDTVLKHLNDELQRKGGILIVFTQLKQTFEFFAPNMIDHYPTFAARYMQDDSEKLYGHFQVDKMKEPKGHFTTANIACVYNPQTKLFTLKDLI